MTKSSLPIVTFALCLSVTVPAASDEIEDLLNTARAEYNSGELRKAVQSLQFTVASIQEKINLDLLKLLPEPRDGWQADDPQAQTAGVAAMLTGTSLSRRYFRDDGAEVQISIMADSPLMPMMTMMLSSPLMMQTNQDAKIYTYSGRRGIIEHEKDSDSWEISLLVADKVLLKVDGSGLQSKEGAEAYLQAVDLAAVEKAFGI